MVYELLADTSHIEEEDEMVFDATLIEFKNHSEVYFFNPEIDYQKTFGAPPILEFVGNLKRISNIDHIGTSPMGLLLVSRRMVDVLLSIGSFGHRLIPTVIYDESISNIVCDPLTRKRTSKIIKDTNLRNEDFYILQLTEIHDCLDKNKTIIGNQTFAESGREYLSSDKASHLALKKPEGGFPPVFFVPELLFYCFSETAKEACENKGLRGLWWRPQP